MTALRAVICEVSLALLYHMTAVCLPCFIMIHNGLVSYAASLLKIVSSFKNKVNHSVAQRLNVELQTRRSQFDFKS